VALLQALFSYLSKSAGKALSAIFGWAVIALFGQTSPREQTLLSAVVAAAAAWPFLLLGTLFPKLALLVVAFVPLAKSVPSLWLRLVWIGLSLLVPIVVGIVVAARGSEENLPEPKWKKLLRGFPITLALAAAFSVMMVLAPILRLVTVLKRREVVRMPALMDRSKTSGTMALLAEVLESRGLPLRRAQAPWFLTAPSRIMLKIGGAAFARMASAQVEYRESGVLSLMVLANETVLRGTPAAVGHARALAAEVYGPLPVIQTYNADARDLEAHIKRVWSIYLEQPRAHLRSDVLDRRLHELSAGLAAKNLPWDEWQIIYRLLLQLDRALRGHEPLLEESTFKPEENAMAESKERPALPGPRKMTKLPDRPPLSKAVPVLVEGLSNRELIGHVIESATLLAKKQTTEE